MPSARRIRIKILDLGEMTFRKNELIQTNDALAMVVSPALAVLIDHPDAGYLLFDTGNDPCWKSRYNRAMRDTYPITRMVSITEALAKEGLAPADIQTLMLSHLHFDHVGGLRQFCNTEAGARVVVSAAELAAANRLGRLPDGPYIRALYADLPGIAFRTFSNALEVAPGVRLFVQACHAEGLAGMQIELAEPGPVVFTSDSVYTEESDQTRTPPGGAAVRGPQEAFLNNLHRLHSMQLEYGASLFYGHDIVQARVWQEKGWIG